jgi:predicted lipoprotein with Yx(FWY)xxD motif
MHARTCGNWLAWRDLSLEQESLVKRWHVISVLITAAAVVSLAACGSSSKASSSSSSTTVSKTKAIVTLRIAKNAKLGKQILVNPAGKTVYLYTPDGTGTKSTVPEAIKKTWPAKVAGSSSITVGPGLNRAKLVVHKQASGVQQVAYDGHLLYTFVGDKKPGEANGQGLGGVWFAVLATGAKAP